MIKTASHVLAAALFALTPAVALAAGPGGSQPRAWVSGSGSDVSTCGTIKTPCRTFQYAHDSIVAPGGTIYVQDAANYVGTAPFTITHAISIINDGVGAATIVAASGDAIAIQASPLDAIFIKGLILDGGGTGTNGINLTSAGSLTVANCTVKGFAVKNYNSATGNAILLNPTFGPLRFNISDTIASGNGVAGLNILNGGGSATGTVKNLNASDNADGLLLSASSASITVVDSVFSQNSFAGLYVSLGSLSFSNSVATGNGSDVFNSAGVVTSYQNNIYNTSGGTIAKGVLH